MSGISHQKQPAVLYIHSLTFSSSSSLEDGINAGIDASLRHWSDLDRENVSGRVTVQVKYFFGVFNQRDAPSIVVAAPGLLK